MRSLESRLFDVKFKARQRGRDIDIADVLPAVFDWLDEANITDEEDMYGLLHGTVRMRDN